MKKLWIYGSLALFTWASCDANNDPQDPKELNQQDKTYMEKMTYTNLGEVDAGKIAMDRGSHPAIKEFGSMMAEDHGKAHDDLTKIARDKDFNLPNETDQEHKNMAAALSSLNGDAFDSTFIYMMISGHDKAIALQQDEITNGMDAEVKNYASEKLSVIQHHRDAADSLAQALFP